MIESVRYLEALKKKYRWTYREMGHATKTAPGTWHSRKSEDRPPTYENTVRLLEAFEVSVIERETLLDLVWKDWLQILLDDLGVSKNGATPNILYIIEKLMAWNPELEREIRYIMSTCGSQPGIEFASNITDMGLNEAFLHRRVLKSQGASRLAA